MPSFLLVRDDITRTGVVLIMKSAAPGGCLKIQLGGGSGSRVTGGRGGWRKGRVPGKIVLVDPHPVPGAGSCGPEESTGGLRAESAAATRNHGREEQAAD